MRTSLASIASILLATLCACSSHDVTAPTEAPDAPPTPIADAMPPSPDGQAHSALTVMRADLAGNHPGALHVVAGLRNAWGLAFDPDPTGPRAWMSANAIDASEILDSTGRPLSSAVSVPGGPSGLVYTESKDLDGDEFVFATESGTILGWQDALHDRAAVRVDDSASGAVYKGLAIINEDPMRLATTDFHNGSVDVYGVGYAEVAQDATSFVDPTMPAGFAPFGIASFGGDVYVTYAKQNAERHDDVKGAGNGFIDVFAFDGKFLRRLVSNGPLNSPWAIALAPSSFGKLAGSLLVGNFGDGAINVFNRETGEWMGQLQDAAGAPIVIDGLWALTVGPKTDAMDLSGHVFFTAGPNGEMDGLFGTLVPL